MKKLISKLHFITSSATEAELACKAGANWIQLRVKNTSEEIWKTIAIETLAVCKNFNAKLIINDNVQLAQEIDADGVHLGKEDMTPARARIILGNTKIIGATANTLKDVQQLSKLNIDYIGLGPYHYTKTKSNLSPILGLEGYKKIMKYNLIEGNTTPIIAIGGINLIDIDSLLQTGVWGIAVSSAIAKSEDIEEATKSFIQQIHQHKSNTREHA